MSWRIELSPTEETLLVPLFGRAAESRRKHAIVRDPKAVEMVASIPWDYERFNQRPRVLAMVLRTAMFDELVRAFLRRNAEGTVVEIGTGLNTRFERVDNGKVHWFDLDLPSVIALRREFFRDSERRRMLAASVTEAGWIETVQSSPGPYFFAAETVFVYLTEQEVKTALARIAASFAGARIALDMVTQRAVTSGNRDFARRNMAARFQWACGHPKDVEAWDIGLRLVESAGFAEIPEALRERLSATARAGVFLAKKLLPEGAARAWTLNVYEEHGAD